MLERLLRAWFDLAAVLLAVVLLGLPSRWLTDLFLYRQDLPVLVGLLALAAAARLVLALTGGGEALMRAIAGEPVARAPGDLRRHGLIVVGVALAAGVICLAGAHLVYDDYALSLDEFMAGFDAAIIAHGAPVAAIPEVWRNLAPALQPQFTQSLAGGAYWSSTYLPVNAALRALGAAADVQALVSPLLTTASVLLVYAIGRRLWPQRPALAMGAAILLASSSQFLVTGMTAYAMNAHLAFNLLWLWLFLRGGWAGHVGALVVGFLACGLHQLAFHPLFVAPFVLQLWLDRRWRLAAIYTLAYGVICLFWVGYEPIVLHLFARAPAVGAATGVVAHGAAGLATGFLAQVVALLGAFDPAGVGLMAKNLIRFATWQNPALVPLLMVGALAAFKARGVERSLALGLALTTAAMFVIMPYQGHGWGYRYVHGLLGSACLLGAWTFGSMTDRLDPAARPGARVVFAGLAVVAVVAILPVRLLQTHRFVHPYAMAEQAIARAPAQLVLVDDRAAAFAVDLVRNDPFLRNRPIALRLASLSPAQLNWLCARASMAVFDRADASRAGLQTFPPSPTAAEVARRTFLGSARCGVGAAPVRDLLGRPIL